MATAAERRSEAGVSLLEALLMVAVLAIVATLVLDVTQGGAERAFDRARQSASNVTENIAEERFRKLVTNAASAGAITRAEADLLTLDTVGDGVGYCRAWPALARIAFLLERDGEGVRLQCRGPRGAEVLARWDDAQAHFSYSTDGVAWRPAWSGGPDAAPPLIRLEVFGARTRTTWVARPGALPVQPGPSP